MTTLGLTEPFILQLQLLRQLPDDLALFLVMSTRALTLHLEEPAPCVGILVLAADVHDFRLQNGHGLARYKVSSFSRWHW